MYSTLSFISEVADSWLPGSGHKSHSSNFLHALNSFSVVCGEPWINIVDLDVEYCLGSVALIFFFKVTVL